ncbi:MAG: penicillin-binding protein activator [Marinobacterium sp.]|nr:penicillin-binding protein activator [Marinobacterium sp.]
MTIRKHLSLTATALALTLAGCTGNPPKPPAPVADRTPAQAADPMTTIEQLLDRAEKAAPIASAQLKADAARQLIELGRQQDASRVLAQINTRLLPPALAFDIMQLQARDALDRDEPQQALEFLNQPQQAPLPDEQALALSELRLQAYEQKQDPVGETRELIHQSNLGDGATNAQRERIWSSLSRLPAQTVSELARDGDNSYYEQGWFELADSLHRSGDLEQKSEAINRWRSEWENHPASSSPPSALEALQQQNRDIRHIALLLPQSGPLSKPARAISEGFLTAYYQARNEGKQVPMLTLLDASKIKDPLTLSTQITDRNINMVIGPLDKDYVQRLSNSEPLPAPILALNYAEQPGSNRMLFQFGLSAEDEARQVAQRAYTDGLRRAAVLSADTGWGRKVSAAFSAEFRKLGGAVHGSAWFTEGSYNTTISQLMNTDKSQARAKQVRKLIRQNKKMEFEEHRRQDLDMVFLSALPNDARQINPTLSFHFANDLPVYATSHVYSGLANAMTDQDLTGIRFVGSPWNLEAPSTNKRSLNKLRNNVDSRFGRLYALGLDAYQLHPFLLQLAALPQSSIEGETGRLSVVNQNQVVRTLDWAIFDQGTPRLLKTEAQAAQR